MSGTVLVTGGAKGVGAAIVRALAAAGHDIDFTYRSSAAQAEALAAEIAADYPGRAIRALPLDLADKDSVEAFCTEIEETTYYGYVHNAGQSYDVLAAMMAQDKAEAIMQVNFFSMTRIVKAVVRR
jgi:3-oxoacyl-[acyl-carrier protein] reductase